MRVFGAELCFVCECVRVLYMPGDLFYVLG